MVKPINFLNNMNTTPATVSRQQGFMKDIPVAAIRRNPDLGLIVQHRFDQFKPVSNVNAAEAYSTLGWKVFGSDGFAITALTAQGGGVSIGSDGDNEGGSLAWMIQQFRIARATKRFWWEVEVAPSAITDAKNNIFCGMVDSTALTATVPITAAGAIADLNLVGFHRPESARSVAGTGGAIMNAVYKANGVAAVTVQTDAAALVAATKTRLGMRYDRDASPWSNDPYTLCFFQDDVKVGSVQIASADGTDFPNDVNLAPCFSILNATGSTPGTLSIYQIMCAQLLTEPQGV